MKSNAVLPMSKSVAQLMRRFAILFLILSMRNNAQLSMNNNVQLSTSKFAAQSMNKSATLCMNKFVKPPSQAMGDLLVELKVDMVQLLLLFALVLEHFCKTLLEYFGIAVWEQLCTLA